MDTPARAEGDNPLPHGEERFHRRWLREHSARVVHEDLCDLEQVREVSRLALLLAHLQAARAEAAGQAR